MKNVLCAMAAALLWWTVQSASTMAADRGVDRRGSTGSGLMLAQARTAIEAPRRTALIIGNSNYQSAPLRNPVNDARAIAESLRRLGFDVRELFDAGQADMKRAIWDFGKKLRDGGVGLFYFSGHGVQVGGENYLVPVGARIEMEPDLELEAVRATRVLAEMDKANNGLNIVILDACRNNPFVRSFRSPARGLAQMRAPVGTLLAYATAPGSVAADGTGDNGLYTSELLAAMTVPGLKIEDFFKRVRAAVREKSSDRQVPWESTSIEGDFYFIPPLGESDAVAPAAPVVGSESSAEVVFWQSIQNSTSAADYEAYLRRFPDGTFADLARNRLQEMQRLALTVPTRHLPAVKELDATYVTNVTANLRSQPSTSSAKVATIPQGSALLVTGKVVGKNWYRVRRENGEAAFVFGNLIVEIDADELAHWQEIEDRGNAEALERFLERYPDGRFAAAAQKRLRDLTAVAQKPAVQETHSVGSLSTAVQQAVGQYLPKYAAGRTFSDCRGCPEMVVVPPGQFLMGSPEHEQGRAAHEAPVHRVVIARPFALGKYEMTLAQWMRCVQENGCDHRPKDEGWGQGNLPVTGISWSDAQQYTLWLSAKTGADYRLPSEAEWEYAARAGTRSRYWWGDEIGRNNANCMLCGSRWDRKQAAPVGSFRANPFGLHDVHGNVWEWQDDCWHAGYAGAPRNGRSWTSGEQCSSRVLRGGSWRDQNRHLRSAERLRYFLGSRFNFVGFRVAKTLEP